MGKVRAAAGRLVERALASRAPLERLLAPELAGLAERDRARLRDLVLGALRWLARLDGVVAAASGRPLGRIDRRLLAPLRIAAYELLFDPRVPDYAAVSEAVEEARRRTGRRGAGFANGVLRKIAERRDPAAWPPAGDDEAARLACETSHPEFLVRRWLARFGRQATRALLAADNGPRPLGLLAFADRGGREVLAERLAGEGVETRPSELAPTGLLVVAGEPLRGPAFARGDFYVQDPASQAAALIPPPRAGERVLDAAAAPGGKSFALVAFEPRARVVAADLDVERLGRLRANLARLERELPVAISDAARPAFAPAFDRVVLDLPCTGTGTLRQHPELKWRLSAGEIGRLAEQALALLAGLAPLVRPGGLLVASSCSLEPEENEEVVDRFLSEPAARGVFALAPLEGALPPAQAAGLFGPGRWRVPTTAENDGFTVQVLQRVEGR